MYGMDQFENELKELRIVLSDVQKQQFEEYYKLLVEWNEVMNLTAITEDVYKRQVLHLGRLHHIMKEETKTECEADQSN